MRSIISDLKKIATLRDILSKNDYTITNNQISINPEALKPLSMANESHTLDKDTIITDNMSLHIEDIYVVLTHSTSHSMWVKGKKHDFQEAYLKDEELYPLKQIFF